MNRNDSRRRPRRDERRPLPGRRPAPARVIRPRGPVGFGSRGVYLRDPAATGRQGHWGVEDAAPACGIKARCGACPYVNLDYAKSLQHKTELGLAVLRDADVLGQARLLPTVPSPKPLEYRASFKLAVRPGVALGARFAIGLFRPGTHDVVDLDDCPLHVPALRALLRDLRAELETSAIVPYDEATAAGDLRYVTARAAHLTSELMLTFVVRTPIRQELRQLTQRLKARGHNIHAAHMNINTESGNAIYGRGETVRVAGADRLRERVCELDFEISPTSFFQINPWQAINLYRRVEQLAGEAPKKQDVAWDLYCGTGQMALLLARLGYKVLAVEENPDAIADAHNNARKNNLEDKVEWRAARVEDAGVLQVKGLHEPELIVVNPSRRGLADAARAHITWLLGRFPQTRLIYVSCNVETLARDLRELTKSGHAVRQVEAFDMFAQADGLEWLAVLTR